MAVIKSAELLVDMLGRFGKIADQHASDERPNTVWTPMSE